MSEIKHPIGELFSRLYIERGAPTQDSAQFRTRLIAYLEQNHFSEFAEIGGAIKRELGLVVPAHGGVASVYYDVPAFLTSIRVQAVCDSITLIWRYLKSTHRDCEQWRVFVARVLREENLAYSVDAQCGVHYFVDEEFERNRVSTLRAAGAPRYTAVRTAFEAAHRYLDADPPDTKASVRSMFEALEILARLMEPGSPRLNKELIFKKLKLSATWLLADATEVKALEKVLDGFAEWVDAMHFYRHGQATEDPVAPSNQFAVYALSSGAAVLRLLLGIDAETVPASA